MSHHRSGLSLVEVMIVLGLLSVGLGSAFNAMGSANTTRQRTEARNQALAAIQSQVEIFQAMDLQAIDSQFGSSDSIPFPVTGLTPIIDPTTNAQMSQAGLVTRVSRVAGASTRTALRFWVGWRDSAGDDHIELYFHHAPRQ